MRHWPMKGFVLREVIREARSLTGFRILVSVVHDDRRFCTSYRAPSRSAMIASNSSGVGDSTVIIGIVSEEQTNAA